MLYAYVLRPHTILQVHQITFSFIFFLITAYNCYSQPEGYRLAWQEEFNSNGKPNQEFWRYENGFVRNRELQWYQKENANIKDGFLIITGKREPVENPNYRPDSRNWRRNRKQAEYTSASINTRGKFDFQFGILEVRAKIDVSKGSWPAIWTLGYDGWPECGEVDVMEYYLVGHQPTILANAAWQGENNEVLWDSEKIPIEKFLEKNPEWASEFHVWKMDWNEHRIKIYLDDQLLNEIELNETFNPDGTNPFRQPHYILLNLAIGSNGGDPSRTEFPIEYVVDYVRVFKKNNQ